MATSDEPTLATMSDQPTPQLEPERQGTTADVTPASMFAEVNDRGRRLYEIFLKEGLDAFEKDRGRVVRPL